MGLNIGPVTGALSALRAAPEFGQARLRGDEAFRARGTRQPDDYEPFGQRPQRDDPNQVRSGFGDGTISPLSAALRTLDRTIQRVRENQLTIDEIREQFQARAAERRAETFRNTRGEDAGNPLASLELRGGPEARLIREFSATDEPERTPLLAPRDASESGSRFIADEIREDPATPETKEPVEARRLERPGPDDVRAERLERTREQNRAERPRFDVRV